MIDLPLVWAFIIAFAVFAYVVMDGFDLGIGILFWRLQPGPHRDAAMNSVAPVWDGNETWLVLGGGGLLAAFPLAYAIVLPALYAPLVAMLLALVFRGVAFEFRWRDPGHRRLWDLSFTLGSLTAALAQGVALGALLQGIPVEGRAYAGGWWDWLTPFSLLTGLSLIAGYMLLGSTWLIMKTEGGAYETGRRFASYCAPALLIAIAAVSLATPFLQADYFARWFAFPNWLYLSVAPISVLLLAVVLVKSLQREHSAVPFLASLGLFLVSFAGLGVSFYPHIVPPALTISAAAAPRESLAFLSVGAFVLIPIILCYTAYSYWVFRGKVADADGYH